MSRSRTTPDKALKGLEEKRYLLAVSAGLDSVCLLHAVVQASRAKELAVAHIDHSLREESVEDALFVESLAASYGLRFFSKRLKAPESMQNIEAWGREERYSFLFETLEREGFDAVITAHHADDVVETLLMRLCFNRPLTTIESRSFSNRLLRPFLSVTKETLSEYARVHHLSFREDESNKDTRFLRNKFRLSIIPYLKTTLGDSIVPSIHERAMSLQEDAEAFEFLLEEDLYELKTHEFGSKKWKHTLIEYLKSKPEAIQWRAVEKLLLSHLGFKLGRRMSLKVCEFFLETRRQIELPDGRILKHQHGKIELE